jgi:hypothetical protein
MVSLACSVARRADATFYTVASSDSPPSGNRTPHGRDRAFPHTRVATFHRHSGWVLSSRSSGDESRKREGLCCLGLFIPQKSPWLLPTAAKMASTSTRPRRIVSAGDCDIHVLYILMLTLGMQPFDLGGACPANPHCQRMAAAHQSSRCRTHSMLGTGATVSGLSGCERRHSMQNSARCSAFLGRPPHAT